jgi:hypothetical protein
MSDRADHDQVHVNVTDHPPPAHGASSNIPSSTSNSSISSLVSSVRNRAASISSRTQQVAQDAHGKAKQYMAEKKVEMETKMYEVVDKAVDKAVDKTMRVVKTQLIDPDMPKFVQESIDALVDDFTPDVKSEVTGQVRGTLMSKVQRERFDKIAKEDDETRKQRHVCCLLPHMFRGRILYALQPYDRSFWQQLRDPLWWVLRVLAVTPVIGVQPLMFALFFMLKDKKDEYQLTQFILDFRGMQFLTMGLMGSMIAAFQYYLCANRADGENTCDEEGKGPGNNPFIYIQSALFCFQVFLVWIAFWLLKYSIKKGGFVFTRFEQEAAAKTRLKQHLEEEKAREAKRAKKQEKKRLRALSRAHGTSSPPAQQQSADGTTPEETTSTVAEKPGANVSPTASSYTIAETDKSKDAGSSKSKSAKDDDPYASAAAEMKSRSAKDASAAASAAAAIENKHGEFVEQPIGRNCWGPYYAGRGGRLAWWVLYDTIVFAIIITLALIAMFASNKKVYERDTAEYRRQEWTFKATLFYLTIIWGLLSFPYIFFKMPVMFQLLTHAKATGYTRLGRCVPVMPAKLRLEEREKEEKRKEEERGRKLLDKYAVKRIIREDDIESPYIDAGPASPAGSTASGATAASAPSALGGSSNPYADGPASAPPTSAAAAAAATSQSSSGAAPATPAAENGAGSGANDKKSKKKKNKQDKEADGAKNDSGASASTPPRAPASSSTSTSTPAPAPAPASAPAPVAPSPPPAAAPVASSSASSPAKPAALVDSNPYV